MYDCGAVSVTGQSQPVLTVPGLWFPDVLPGRQLYPPHGNSHSTPFRPSLPSGLGLSVEIGDKVP